MGCTSCDRQPSEGRTSFNALAQAYEEAHAQGDIDALLDLVYVGAGPAAEMNRRWFRTRFEHDLKRSLKRIRRTRLTRDQRDVLTHPTLKPRGNIEIEWTPPDPLTVTPASFYPYGKRDGIYYIAATGPEAIEEDLRAWSRGDDITIRQPGVRQRAELALSRWRNDMVDPEPILFWATHSRPDGRPSGVAFNFYDEDMDVVGFGVEERHTAPNGTVEILEEEYPVLLHLGAWNDVLNMFSVPISIRNAGQRVDTQQWARYTASEPFDAHAPKSREAWEATLPPVWVSRSEPNAVEVNVYVYDRAGHRSTPIPLLNSFRKD